MEGSKHKLLKLKASAWLRSRGCKDIRKEVRFLNGQLKIDVVGYKDNEPVIGIECGVANNDSNIYQQLAFPVFSLPYTLIYEHDDADINDIPVEQGRPYHLLNGAKFYHAREKILTPYKIWREAFERERSMRRKEQGYSTRKGR